MWGIDKPSEASFGWVLEDECFHQVVTVVPVDEVVDDGVQTAVKEREPLGDIQCCIESVLQCAVEWKHVEKG